MAEGGVQAPDAEDTQSKPPTDGQQPNPATTPPWRRRGSVWFVLVVPTIVIGLAAVAGYLAGELATLGFGIATMAGLIGFVAYRIPGRRPWLIPVCVCAVVIPLSGLGWLRVMATRGGVAPPVTAAPPVSPAFPTVVNAGRRFTQQNINNVTSFRGADLRGAQLVGLDLRGVDFSGANAAGASFEGSRLDRAIFRGADLDGAVLRRACLRNVVLHGADLTGAVATGADVSGVDLTPEETSLVTDWPRPSVSSSACAY